MQEKPTELIQTGEKPSIFWQDEILQVMYWMRGEGFGERINIAQLQKFLDTTEDILLANLSELEKKDLIVSDFLELYELTATGIKEGGRRFADEFEGMTKQGHYECDDPNCDCQSGEPCLVTAHDHL